MIRAELKVERRRKMETVGKAMEKLLTGDSPLPCKSWRIMRGWHRAAVDHSLLTA